MRWSYRPAQVSAPQSIQHTWTVLQHSGPDHLGLWLLTQPRSSHSPSSSRPGPSRSATSRCVLAGPPPPRLSAPAGCAHEPAGVLTSPFSHSAGSRPNCLDKSLPARAWRLRGLRAKYPRPLSRRIRPSGWPAAGTLRHPGLRLSAAAPRLRVRERHRRDDAAMSTRACMPSLWLRFLSSVSARQCF